MITGPHLTATLVGAGGVDCDLMYATGKLRAGEVAFGAATTFTSGMPNAGVHVLCQLSHREWDLMRVMGSMRSMRGLRCAMPARGWRKRRGP